MTAHLEDGVLKVFIKKRPELERKRTAIKVT